MGKYAFFGAYAKYMNGNILCASC